MKFESFGPQHFDEYRQWFTDQVLNNALGPAVDQEWLDYILSDDAGKQFAVFKNALMVAVVGVVRPNLHSDEWTITDVAINPSMRRSGIGKQVLRLLEHELDSSQMIAFVDVKNTSAFEFFQSLGWIHSATADEHGMFKFSRQ